MVPLPSTNKNFSRLVVGDLSRHVLITTDSGLTPGQAPKAVWNPGFYDPNEIPHTLAVDNKGDSVVGRPMDKPRYLEITPKLTYEAGSAGQSTTTNFHPRSHLRVARGSISLSNQRAGRHRHFGEECPKQKRCDCRKHRRLARGAGRLVHRPLVVT